MPRTRWLWWMVLVLVSGAGLVALAVFNLWQAVREADAQRELEARDGAAVTATALRTTLRSPALVEVVPERFRFAVRDGAVQVPPEVGWLQRAPGWEADRPFALEVQERLDEAARAEFVDADREAARRAFDVLLESGELGGRRPEVLVRAAWQAHRAGEVERRDALLGEAGVPGGRALAAAALLHQAAQGRLPDAFLPALQRMPPEEAPGVLARLSDHGGPGTALAAAVERTARRRQGLRAAREMVRGEPVGERRLGPRAVDGHVVVSFPHGDAAAEGVAVPPGPLLELLRGVEHPELPPQTWTGEPVRLAGGETEGHDLEVVVPGLLGVRPRPAEPAPWAHPGVLAGVVGGLALVFAVGLFLSLRAAHREADAMKARAEFLTVVTHELKTPLASIRLLAEMLEEGRVGDAERQREYYGLLSGEAARLSMLIENVLDLGRMDRGERAYDIRSQSVEDLVHEAGELMRPVLAREGVALETDLAAPPTWAAVDRGAVLQALLNVLDNARKYGAGGGRIAVATRRAGDRHEITVRDFGPGVPEEEREGVFLRFVRGREFLDGSVPGVGLGLYLARTILRRHGGDLVCEVPGDGRGGARFRFTLPLPERQPVLGAERAARSRRATGDAARGEEPA